jgi:hypothetical protein
LVAIRTETNSNKFNSTPTNSVSLAKKILGKK